MSADIIELILRLKDEASKGISTLGKEAEKSEKRTANLQKTVLALGAGATTAAGSLGLLIRELADYRNKIADTSTATGLGVKTIAALDLGARSAGSSIDELGEALKGFPKRLSDARRGTGEALPALQALGLATDVVSGRLSDADDAMEAVLASLVQVESQTERAALATQLFGESGGRMLAIVGDNAEALKDLSVRAEVLGVSLSEDAVKGSKDFQAALADLEVASKGFADKILQGLGAESGLSGLIDDLTVGIVFLGSFMSATFREFGVAIDKFANNLAGSPAVQLILALADGNFDKVVTEAKKVGVSVGMSGGNFAVAAAKGIVGQGFDFDARAVFRQAQNDALNAVGTRGSTRGVGGGGGGGGGGGSGLVAPGGVAAPSRAILPGQLTDASQISRQSRISVSEIEPPQSAEIRDRAMERRQAILGGARTAGGVLGSLATGTVPGPFGALASIGAQGAGGVRESLTGFKDTLIAAFKALPEIISEVIPEFVTSLVTEVIPALIENAPAILKSLVIDLPLAIAKALIGLPVQLIKVPKKGAEVIARQFEMAGVGDAAAVRNLRQGNAHGGFVERSGLRMVHEGNVIGSSAGHMSQSAKAGMGAMGGSGPSIDLRGATILDADKLLEELGNRLQMGGGGFSPVFGGG